jgi:hypothetical protein
MKKSCAAESLVATLLLFAVSAISVCAGTTGRLDFVQNCAFCHGTDAKGSGEALYTIPGVKPPDLTKLAGRNGGVFPAEHVYKAIDGNDGIPSHTRFNMPFWGTAFQEQGKEFTPESEAAVKERISNLVSYIKSIQEK